MITVDEIFDLPNITSNEVKEFSLFREKGLKARFQESSRSLKFLSFENDVTVTTRLSRE